MAKRKGTRASSGGSSRPSSARRRPSSGAPGSTLGGLAVVAALLAGGTYLYRHTAPSAAAIPAPTRSSAPAEPAYIPVPPRGAPASSSARPADQVPDHPPLVASAQRPAPFGTSEEVFEGGARLYAANCAGCHGRPGRNAKGPTAAQFWDPAHSAGAHAVAQPVGTIYQAIAAGNLVQGMPSFGQRLTDTQLWDLALLLKSAHQDLPDPVLRLLRGGQ